MSSADFSDLYTLTDEVLGSGGFSEVFAGYRVNDGRKVAVKVMDPACTKYSMHEVEILKMINHRNVIQFFDYFEYDAQCLLVMECLEGGELLDRIISKHSYDENIARDAARNIILAIQHCHAQNILHRDLKPENLLLRSHDDDAELVLADFGAATLLPESGSLSSHCVGTIGYIAPEILAQQLYSKPVDMWSFGVILYILLVGQFPFEDDSQVLCEELKFQEEELGQLSHEARSLVRSLLKRNPMERLTAEQVLQHSWMHQPASVLMRRDLSGKVPALNTFLAKRKFKGGVHAVIAMGKLTEKLRQEKEEQEVGQLVLPPPAVAGIPLPVPPYHYQSVEAPVKPPAVQDERVTQPSPSSVDPPATQSTETSEANKSDKCTIH